MKPARTSISKITRPRLPRILPRKRLFRLLDANKNSPVTWVSGPAGSGKTTLVASWLDSRKLPCIWYQADEGDADIASFFYYLGLAAKKAAPRYKRPLPLLTPEYGLGVPTFTRNYFEQLFSRLAPPHTSRPTPHGFIIVFDNFQDVPEASPFHDIVMTGLSVLPRGIRAVVVSRSEPPPAFAGLLAGNKLHMIGWDDLRLTMEESNGITKLQNAGEPHDKLLKWIHEKTEGWTAGVVLLARAMKSQGIDSSAVKNIAPEKVFDYFASEVFDRLDEPTQDFLLKTVFLPKIASGPAEKLTGNKAAGRILSDLNRMNYFAEKRIQPDVTYQYHALFREFLLEKAQEAFPADELFRIRHRAARLCEEAGQSEDAVELFLAGGAWNDAARSMLRQAPALFVQGRGKTLVGWIETLPGPIIAQGPYLLYWKGMCLLPFSLPQGREHLEKAFHLFEEGQDAEGVFLAWSGMVNSYLIEWNDFTPLAPWIEWLDKRLSEGSTPPPAVYARVAVSMTWALTYTKPWHPKIRTWIDRAMSLSRDHLDPNLRIQACIAVSTYNYFMGEESLGVLPAREGRRIVQTEGVTPVTLLGMKFIEIILHWLTAAPESTGRLISESLAMAEKTGVHVYDSMLYSYAVCDFLTKGDLAGAGALLRKMETTAGNVPRSALGHYHLVAAWYHLLRNDLPSAAVHAEQSVLIGFETGMPFGEAYGRIVLAFVLQQKGEPGKAREQIETVRQLVRKTKSSLFEWLCNLAEAWAAFNEGREEHGFEALKRAMAIGRAKGFMNFEGWLPSVMTGLCVKALERGIETEYVKDLIRKRGLVPDVPPYECDAWPWPVKIFVLGGFKLMLNDVPVVFGGKVQKKPLELLKMLVAAGGRDVSEELVIDTLWPDAAGDLAHKSFDMALHRLRRMIGRDDAVRRYEGILTLDGQQCWVDAWAFERAVGSAEFGARSEKAITMDPESAIRNRQSEIMRGLGKALQMYHGHFLPADAKQSWSTGVRERLRSKFLRLVTHAGGQYERGNEWQKAADCYEYGLERDAVCEEFYQRLMLCHDKLGRRAEAVKTYQRCRAALRDGLDIEPSSRTEEIYSSLLRNK